MARGRNRRLWRHTAALRYDITAPWMKPDECDGVTIDDFDPYAEPRVDAPEMKVSVDVLRPLVTGACWGKSSGD